MGVVLIPIARQLIRALRRVPGRGGGSGSISGVSLGSGPEGTGRDEAGCIPFKRYRYGDMITNR